MNPPLKLTSPSGCCSAMIAWFFVWMRKYGYLGTRGSNRNATTQRSMELGLFNITTKVTGKGKQYFINKLLSSSVVKV